MKPNRAYQAGSVTHQIKIRYVAGLSHSDDLHDLINEAEDLERERAEFRDEADRLSKIISQARQLNDSQSNSPDQWEDMDRLLKKATE